MGPELVGIRPDGSVSLRAWTQLVLMHAGGALRAFQALVRTVILIHQMVSEHEILLTVAID